MARRLAERKAEREAADIAAAEREAAEREAATTGAPRPTEAEPPGLGVGAGTVKDAGSNASANSSGVSQHLPRLSVGHNGADPGAGAGPDTSAPSTAPFATPSAEPAAVTSAQADTQSDAAPPFASTPEPPLRETDLPCLTGSSYTINVSASTVMQNNLGGVGPDSGDPVLRYGAVGFLDGQPIDLLVEVVDEHNYTAPLGSSANGGSRAPKSSGDFGQINLGYGQRTKLRFTFLSAGSMDEEVKLQLLRWNIYDLDTDDPMCKEMVMADSKDQPFSYELAKESEVRLHEHGTQKWFMSNHESNEPEQMFLSELLHKADKPTSPTALTKQQAARSIALVFDNVSSFELEFAVATPNFDSFALDLDECGQKKDSRNILFEASTLPLCPSPSPSPSPLPPLSPSSSPLPKIQRFGWSWYHDGSIPGMNWEAVEKTCEKRGSRLCRYSEICPKGAGNHPNGGIPANKDVRYSPYLRADGTHDYVAVGRNATCSSVLDLEGASAVAELKSLPPSMVKEDYMCCKGEESYSEYPFLRWLPKSAHLSWKQAEFHCRSPPGDFPTLGYSMRLCTYDEICPYGEEHPPQGGYPADEPLWAAYARNDGVNDNLDYVSVGTGGFKSCTKMCGGASCGNASLLSTQTHEMKRYMACCR